MHALLLALACSGSGSDTLPDGTVPIAASDVPPEDRSLTFAFRPRGVDGAIPSELALHANLPLFPERLSGKAPPEGTTLTLNPPVEGELLVLDRATLVFRPLAPFAPSTTYQVRVDAIGTVGKTEPDWKKDWQPRSASFTTPAFGLLRGALDAWDPKKARAEVRLTFAGPVDAGSVGDRLTVVRDGDYLRVRQVLAGATPEEVRLVLEDPGLRSAKGGGLELDVAAGVPLASGVDLVAPAGSVSVPLVDTPSPVIIRTAKVREGANGFYVDVYCDDGAVPTKRWWWDRDGWEDWQVSTRCALSPDSVGAVHLSGAGALEVTPSDGGFRVFGELPFGPTTLRIDAGARTVDGGVLPATFERALEVPHRDATVGFVSTGRYLPRSAWKNLAFHHTNVADVEVEVRHVPSENLVFWLAGSEGADERTSDVVARTRLAVSSPMDASVTSYLDVASLVPDARSGVYQIRISEVHPEDEVDAEDTDAEPADTGSGWHGGGRSAEATTAARLVLTDMHLLAKIDGPVGDRPWGEKVHVWTVDVHHNGPLADVDVSLVRPSGKTVGTCRTDRQGGCVIDVPTDPLDPTEPLALVARKGEDLTYLAFKDLELGVADAGGERGGTSPAHRAAVWTDRGVYRPGDVAHVGVLVRDREHHAPTGALPVLVRAFDPRGKELRRQVVDTNEAGMLAVDIPFAGYASTGHYRVSAEVGGLPVGDTSFQVEEFVPERLRVEARARTAALRLGDPMRVDVEAGWLFGGSAAGQAVELSCTIETSEFKPAKSADYHYGPARLDGEPSPEPLTLGTATGTLDAEGRAALACPAPSAARGVDGPSTLVARAAVYEGSSGRTTVATARAAVHPDRSYPGLKASADRLDAGKPVVISGVVVGWDGAPVSGTTPVKVEVFRIESEVGYVWNVASSTSEYRRMLRRARDSTPAVEANGGTFSLTLEPKDADAAGYLVSAVVGAARTELYLPMNGQRWWWTSLDGDVDQTPRPLAPAHLAVSVPDLVKVGQASQVSVTAPYGGRLLWTMESQGVIRSEWKDATAGVNTWSVAVPAFVPNVYVSALLLKDPHLESAAAFLPDRAFGVASMKVEPTDYVMPVTLTVPAEARPNTPLQVVVDVGPQSSPTWASVYVVDEGILSLTGFDAPDPADALFARQALGVRSFETVGWTLLSRPASTGRRTGGDAAGSLGRVQMVKPVALWSGLIGIPKTGKTTLNFGLPAYRGSLRVMAVVASATRMGHAAASVVVREPLVLQTTAPRFLLTGDRALIPVEVSNQSGAAQNVQVSLEVQSQGSPVDAAYVNLSGQGPRPSATLGGGSSGLLRLAAGARGTLVFQVAAAEPGAVTLRVNAKAGALSSSEILDVPVIAAAPELRRTMSMALGGDADLSAAVSGWVDGTDRSTVWITRNPYGAAMTHLRELLRYPHGCIEQTTSSARPLLYVKTLAPELTPDLFLTRRLEEMVQYGIDRVASMQTARGGFSYWPGSTEPNLWGTVYATQFLMDARDAGYPVSVALTDDAIGYLGREASANRSDWAASEPYALYLLARAGKARNAQATQALRQLPDSALAEQRYLLQAALWQGGDRVWEKDLRSPPTSFRAGRDHRTYSSDLRQMGLILSVYRDLFGNDRGGDALAAKVAAGLAQQDGWRYTTQEIAWGLTGLARSIPDGPVDVEPIVTTAAGPVRGTKGPTGWTWLFRDMGGETLRASGPGLTAVITTEGNRTDGAPAGGSGLRLTREWLGPDGTAITGPVPLGLPVYVRLTLQNVGGARVEDVALTDRVPAGFEIENPRLGRGSIPDWADPDSVWEVDSLDLRDDRLSAFGGLDAGQTVTVVYGVRAVTAGEFTSPEAYAVEMYDPSVWARVTGGRLRIDGRWAGSVL